ncbi:unnamed protein product [Trichogramma brassicae]|uniref:Uncharacterized protein n=1 Tax=Trichogramma brassicae TaxID=86971 RepID=A0A6H5J164_9HYME|nr:unnamed protein product [Trichogramma brassicae]
MSLCKNKCVRLLRLGPYSAYDDRDQATITRGARSCANGCQSCARHPENYLADSITIASIIYAALAVHSEQFARRIFRALCHAEPTTLYVL